MKKFLILSLAALTLASVGAMAQGESNVPEGKRITCYHVYSDKAPHFSPKRGDWSIGVTFNPATLSYRLKMQPKVLNKNNVQYAVSIDIRICKGHSRCR